MIQYVHTKDDYLSTVGAASPPRLSAEATLVAKAGQLSGQECLPYRVGEVLRFGRLTALSKAEGQPRPTGLRRLRTCATRIELERGRPSHSNVGDWGALRQAQDSKEAPPYNQLLYRGWEAPSPTVLCTKGGEASG